MQLKQTSVISQGQGVEAPDAERPVVGRARVPVFDDLLEHLGLTRPWVAIALGSVLYLLYLLAVYVDGFQDSFGYPGFWKSTLEPVAILTYVLLVHRVLDVYGRAAVQSARPVVDLDDKAFNDLVARMSAAILRYQWVPMILFPVLSVPLVEAWDWPLGFRWSALVARSTSLMEYAVIGSAMYLVVARNRSFTNLFKQPLKVDVFNPAPVRPMGRWGLSVSAALMGGVTISVLLVGADVTSLDHLTMYLVATAVAILAFFGSLSSTHRILVYAKEKELSATRARLSAMYRDLKTGPENGGSQGMGETHNTIALWLAYEKRISEAQEWPFTANTLGGLFATVLLPIAVTVIQQIILRL